MSKKDKSIKRKLLVDKDIPTYLLDSKAIVLFDGYCNLCSWSVQFILKRDHRDHFRFASVQSDIGKEILSFFEINDEADKSVILIENELYYLKSDAALRIARKLRRLWTILYILIIIPKFMRDFIYMFISKNRYKWFGKKQECYLPDSNTKNKFLEF